MEDVLLRWARMVGQTTPQSYALAVATSATAVEVLNEKAAPTTRVAAGGSR